MKHVLSFLLLATFSLSVFAQGDNKKAKLAEPAPLMSVETALRTWPVDEGWSHAPGVPDSMLDVVKPPRMHRNKVLFSHPVLVWVPENTEKIRAMLMIVMNSDSKEFGMYERVRDVCRKHDVAVIYMRFSLQQDLTDTQPLLEHIAEKTGIEEFAHAPWISFGKSSQGKHAFYPWWKTPSRVIASISYHAETPAWPMEEWSTLKDESILHVSVNGETEWGGTYFRHVRPALLNYRQHTRVLGHQVVGKNISHGNYPDGTGQPSWGKPHPGQIRCIDSWNYLALFIDKAIQLRVPPGYPTKGPFELKAVNPRQGLLVHPYAIEDMFQSERHPLVKTGKTYHAEKGSSSATNGFAIIPPAQDYQPAAGVPVVELTAGIGPRDWLLVKKMRFAMQADPMKNPQFFQTLRPVPGDPIVVDEQTFTWEPIADIERGNRKGGAGGIALQGDIQPAHRSQQMSILGYTVLKVTEPGFYKVQAGFSLAVRVQLALNGQPVDHQQIVQLEPGLYPLVMGIRMKGALWGHVEPHVVLATDKEVLAARESQRFKEQAAQELKDRFAKGPLPRNRFIKPYHEVPEAERKDYLWLPDQELADLWFWYHDVERLRTETKK